MQYCGRDKVYEQTPGHAFEKVGMNALVHWLTDRRKGDSENAHCRDDGQYGAGKVNDVKTKYCISRGSHEVVHTGVKLELLKIVSEAGGKSVNYVPVQERKK